MSERTTYLLRVWLPDRPGALGAVASRLGALKGDVVGLEIIERHGGRAIDELSVSLPSDLPIELVAREVSSEEDVEVEDIRPITDTVYDPQLDALETAAMLLGAQTAGDLSEALCEHVGRCVRSSWVAVVGPSGVVDARGEVPNDAWLQSFVSASPAASAKSDLDIDTIWMPLPAADMALVVGRHTPFRAKERQRLAALARVADSWFHRLTDISRLQSRLAHPAIVLDHVSQ